VNRVKHLLRELLMFAGMCAAVVTFVIFIPQGARTYLLDFVFSCGVVSAAVALTWPVDRLLRRMPPWVTVPAVAAGYFFLIAAFHVSGGAIEQRYPGFQIADRLAGVARQEWLTQRWDEARLLGMEFAAVMLALMSVDAMLQSRQPDAAKDFAYYPRIGGLGKSLCLVQGRLILILGLLLLFVMNADLALAQWPRGRAASPDLALTTCILGWNLLWIVDCLSRPRCATLWVPVAFLFCAAIAMPASNLVWE
jgi:hypothetical protein